jgi:phage I-like protein
MKLSPVAASTALLLAIGTQTVTTTVSLDATLCGDDKPKQVWIQLAKAGQWSGHRAGPFQFTAQTFDEIVRNFNATENRRIAIDYEHASEQAPTEGSIPTQGAPACGWIVAMQNRGDSLWGLVEWMPHTRKQILNGEYMFFSPAVVLNARDRVSGKPIGAYMSSGAVTNKPFLDGMQPLAARDDRGEPISLGGSLYSTGEYMPIMKRVLGLPELATARQCMDALKSLEKMSSATGDGHSFQGIPVTAFVRDLRDMMRMPMGSTLPDMFKLARKMCRAAMVEMNEAMEGVDEDDAGLAMSTGSNDGGNEMDHAKLLSEAQGQVSTLNVQLSEARGQVSELTIKLTAAQTEATAQKERADKAEAAVAEIKSKEVEAEVDAALLSYGTSKGIKPEQKPHLLSWAQKQHLLANLTGTGGQQTGGNAGAGGAPPGGAVQLTFTQRVDALVAKGVDIDVAYDRVGKNLDLNGGK